jgi:hypothetical protein
MPAGPEPTTAARLPDFADGGSGNTQPSSQPLSMMKCSIDLIPTGSSLMLSVHASSQGAGHIRPVNSGKLLVECSTSSASRHWCRYTRSFQSGMMLWTGHPDWQNGIPQSMQRAPCSEASVSASVRMNSR